MVLIHKYELQQSQTYRCDSSSVNIKESNHRNYWRIQQYCVQESIHLQYEKCKYELRKAFDTTVP